MDAGPVLGRALGKDLAGAGLALIGTGPALDRHEAWAAGLDGDILRVGVHSLPGGDSLRVGGQESGPRRRRMPPAARKRTRPCGMSPAVAVRLQAERPTPCPIVLLYSEPRPCH